MRKHLSTLPLFFLLSASAWAHECATRLAIDAFRDEVRAAQHLADDQLPGTHKRNEYKKIFLEANVVRSSDALAGGAVLSFGSGPDVLRPIADFPLATDIHLIDHMRGWGEGPNALFNFLKVALSSLPKAIFSIEHSMMVDFGPLGKTEMPTEIVVRWISPALGLQIRRIHLHPIDYNEPHAVPQLIADISTKGQAIVGIVATGLGEKAGARLPKWVDVKGHLHPALTALHPGGTLVLEYFAGALSDTMVFEGLKKRPAYSVTEIGNDTFMNQYLPRLYLFTAYDSILVY